MAKTHGNKQFNATQQIASTVTDTGVQNAYVISTHPKKLAYTLGLLVSFTASNNNTGPSTLNVDGLGVRSIKKDVTADLAVNDILAGQVVVAVYDGTNFQWIGSKVTTIQNGVVFGGQVTWQGNYDFNIEAAGYYINFQYFTSDFTSVTLSAPDGTFDRIDTFIVDNLGVASVLEGDPSATPAESPIDLGTQLRLSSVLVQTGSTQPTVNAECIYLENTEWTTGGSNGGRINANSTNNPHSGTKTVEATSPINVDSITFATAGFIPLDTYTILHFWLRAKANWDGIKRIILQWYNGATAVGSAITVQGGSYGFVATNTTNYQEITIPLTSFGLTPTSTVTTLRITVGTPSAFTGWYLDDMCLQSTTVAPTPIFPTFNSGVIYDSVANTVQFGSNPLLHNTDLYTQGFIQTFRGATVYDYPYQFKQVQNFSNSTSIASFHNAGGITGQPDFQNTVRFGINYTGAVYPASPALPGYFNNRIGYWIGPNSQGHGSFGIYTDDTNSKLDGILFHTLDTTTTDAITFFAKHPPTADNAVSITAGGTGLQPHIMGVIHDDGSWQFNKYGTGTFDDTPVRALGVTALGKIITFVSSAVQDRFGIFGEDDIAGEDRNFDIGSTHIFNIFSSILGGGTNLLRVDPIAFEAFLQITDGTSNSFIDLGADTANNPNFQISAYNGTNSVYIQGYADAQTISINAGNGLIFGNYGIGTFLNTPAYAVGVDASGNVIEFSVAGLAPTTADNGLIMSTATNVQLGDPAFGNAPLLHDTYITAGAFGLRIDGSSNVLTVVGSGASGTSLSVLATSTNAVGISAFVSEDDSIPAHLVNYTSNNNGVLPLLKITRSAQTTPSNGIGGSIDFWTQNDNVVDTNIISNQIISKLTDVTTGTEVSQFSVIGTLNGTPLTLLSLAPDFSWMSSNDGTADSEIQLTAGGGSAQFSIFANDGVNPQASIVGDGTTGTIHIGSPGGLQIDGILEFTNNADAISNGLTTGMVYRTADALKIVH